MRVVIAADSATTRSGLREAVLATGLLCSADDCVGIDDLQGRLQNGSASLVLVSLPGGAWEGPESLERVLAAVPVPVFLVGPAGNTAVEELAARHGARAYLQEGNVRQELLHALAQLRQAKALRLRWGKTLAFIGAGPGMGTTTVASNVAFALARNYPQRVVLAELAAGVPEMALKLDLLPPHPLVELAASWKRLDQTMVRQALAEHSAGLFVLANQPAAAVADVLGRDAVRQLVVLLRCMFTFATLDLGRPEGPSGQESMTLADTVVVVLRLDVPSVRLTQGLLEQLDDWKVPRHKLRLAVNRYGQRCELPWKQAQKALGVEIAEWVPDDPGRVNYALNHGQSVLQAGRWSAIARSFLGMAERLNGVAHQDVG